MFRNLILVSVFSFLSVNAFSQKCNCETEVKSIAGFMEKNYAGFKDKQAIMTKAGYDKMLKQYLALAKGPHADEHCLMIISQYLQQFKDHHVSVRANFDATKLDSAYLAQREIIPLSDKKIAELRKSHGIEGVYDFHDPAKYKIAVMKDKTPLRDYVAVIISSNLPGWKPGMIKWEGKMINDTVARGVLYVLNGMPKAEGFYFKGDRIYGDWHREGTTVENPASSKYEPVAFKKLSPKTAYLKVSTFDSSNGKNIDSIINANKASLNDMPNLVIDLRGNGGGADWTFAPLMNLVYTGPVKHIGNDLLSTDTNIEGWKVFLTDEDRSEENKQGIRTIIKNLEANKGKMVTNTKDFNITGYTAIASPKKVVILIDKGCASSTEEFLLEARQSKKVILMGENTSGTLDYSNVLTAPFPCMPYTIGYSSSRSRRIDVGQGIDNVGIKPAKYLQEKDDWIEKAKAELEN
ncbi:S41 family peptidase [Mucilaginibacter phyllosphaerae]